MYKYICHLPLTAVTFLFNKKQNISNINTVACLLMFFRHETFFKTTANISIFEEEFIDSGFSL